MLCNKLSQTFFDGSSDERHEHGSSDENLHPAMPLPSSSTSSWAQEEQLYHKPTKERQNESNPDIALAYAGQSEVAQDSSQRVNRQRRISQPHIARPMDFLRPVTSVRSLDQQPIHDDTMVENEEPKLESVPLNVLLDSYTTLLDENNDSTATNACMDEDYLTSSSSGEEEQSSQFSEEFIQQASHKEVLNRINCSNLRLQDRFEVIGHFLERLRRELYIDMPTDTKYCVEKMWSAEAINSLLYTQGVPHVQQVIRDVMVRFPLLPLYKKIVHSGESDTLRHKYNPVTKPNIYSNGLPGEGVARAYFKARTAGYTRWKGTHLYKSSSLRKNFKGEEEIVDDNSEEDVMRRQESDATRASLEMFPPHEQEKILKVLRDTLNTQKTADDDALAYWTKVLRPFGFDENFQSKIISAPYADQPEDVQQLLVECLLWAEKIDRIPFEHFYVKEPLQSKDAGKREQAKNYMKEANDLCYRRISDQSTIFTCEKNANHPYQL